MALRRLKLLASSLREDDARDFPDGGGSLLDSLRAAVLDAGEGLFQRYADAHGTSQPAHGEFRALPPASPIDAATHGVQEESGDTSAGVAGADSMAAAALVRELVAAVADGGGVVAPSSVENASYSAIDAAGSACVAVIECVAGEFDPTLFPVTVYLESNVTNYALAGDGDLDVTGNMLDNAITGNGGDNMLQGGAGDDVLTGGAGDDALYGGKGTDRAEFSGARSDYEITPLYTGKDGSGWLSGYEVSSGEEGVDFIGRDVEYLRFGDEEVALEWEIPAILPPAEPGDPIITFPAVIEPVPSLVGGGDVHYDGQGDDTLSGGAADDTLFGDAGDDLLAGGAGDDMLYGGKGTDRAEFSGPRSDYAVTPLYIGKDGSGWLRGYEVSSAEEGVDFIGSDVEYLRFSDEEVALEWEVPVVLPPAEPVVTGIAFPTETELFPIFVTEGGVVETRITLLDEDPGIELCGIALLDLLQTAHA